jgi:D-lactate dehydrogenase
VRRVIPLQANICHNIVVATIHFFDTSPDTSASLGELAKTSLPGQAVEFHPGTVIPEADAVVIAPFVSSRVTADMIAAMPQLKLIATRSTGYDHIDLAAATKHGVHVCNVPSYGENTVAEYAFGLLLALTRKIPQAIDRFRAGDSSHEVLQGLDLMGKTLGIIGAGRIGCHAASIGRGFGMTVLAYDAYPDPKRAQTHGFTYAGLEEVLQKSDIVSLHVPNLPETKHLINTRTLALLKPTAILINTARGEVVESRALIDALDHGRLAGAALDVFEGEQLAAMPEELAALRAKTTDRLLLEHNLELSILQKFPNVILTNHNAFNTIEAVARINQTTVENIASFLSGKLTNEVHPA